MNPIEPIGSDRVREIVPVEPVTRRRREDDDQGRKEQQQQRQRSVRVMRPAPEDDDLPHVDVVV